MDSSRNKMAHNISAAKCEMKPDMKLILSLGGIFVLSGVLQPILMAIAENAGIADSTCMIYMFPYYFGPFLLSFTLCFPSKNPNNATNASPSFRTCFKAVIIAFFDLTAQSMNYSGAAMAGPTLFAIIYSSVTVWTAVLSLIILKRQMICIQWLGVVTVFGGLVITGLDSVALGPKVFHGSCLVLFGSAMHALTYVLSESIMTSNKDGPALSIVLNCSIQTFVAMILNLTWQLTYTRKHFNELILVPMQERNTTPLMAFYILGAIGLANLVHASTFFYTLKHFPGGSTSAGVGKGLQAVLVFVATSALICDRFGGPEMCFSIVKLISLVTVGGGVIIFARGTEQVHKTEVSRKPQTIVYGSVNTKYDSIPNRDDVGAVV